METKNNRISLTDEEVIEFYKTLGLGTEEERVELLQHVLFSSDEPRCDFPLFSISNRTVPSNP